MDNFFKNMFRKREAVPQSTAPTASSQTVATTATYEEKIVRVRNPQLALTVSAVYRAVELRAKTEAQFCV